MLLYDVTYPHSRACDRAVSERYLDGLAKDSRLNGALATCLNGERQLLRLVDGEWVDVTKHKPFQPWK